MKSFLKKNYPENWKPTINRVKLVNRCESTGYIFDMSKLDKFTYHYICLPTPIVSVECGDVTFTVTHRECTNEFTPVDGVCSKFIYVCKYEDRYIYEICLVNANYLFKRIFKLLHVVYDATLLVNYSQYQMSSVFTHYCK